MVPRVAFRTLVPLVKLIVPWLLLRPWIVPLKVPVVMLMIELLSRVVVVVVRLPVVRVMVEVSFRVIVLASRLLVLAVMVLLLEMLISFRACEFDPRSPPKVLLLFRLTVPTALVRPWIVPVMVPVPIARVEVLSVRVIVVALIALLLVAASRVAADEIIMLFRALVAPMLLADSKV